MLQLQQTREVIKYCAKYVKGKTLDFGAGTAKYKKIIAPLTSEYVAFDMVAGPNIDVVGDILSSPFQDAEFETIICSQVLEHIQKPWLVAKEINRILKVDGICIVTVPFLIPYHADPSDFFRFTKQGLISIFEDSGFKIIESGTYGGNYTVLADLFRFTYLNPYKRKSKLQERATRYLLKISKILDKLSKGKIIYSNSFVIAEKYE
jgi:SAM-dependent methyltransferase